jgi:aryl-alcohol dehydrogenase-like predicted oxidoreductase
MQYKTLGKSGLQVSVIGFGCMSLGSDQQHNTRLIGEAVDNGINFFDTADLYDKGWNEESVGKAIRSYRDKIVLATKVGNRWRADGSGWDWDPRKKYIVAAVEKSLQRLQTDHIDLYQLHGGTIEDPIDETIEAFELLKATGKIRQYGISSIRPNVIREYIKRSSICSVMMQYSLLDRRPEEECLSMLQQHNIAVLCRGTLAQGLLTGKPAKQYLGYSSETTMKIAETVKELSSSARTAAQTALKFVLQHPAVTSAVAGIRTSHQLEEIVAVNSASSLSAGEMERLRQVASSIKYSDHR